MIRRSFIAALFAPLLARFVPKPTTTLSAAGEDAPTTIECIPISIDPDTTYLFLTQEITMEQLTRRYPSMPRSGDTITIRRPPRYTVMPPVDESIG